MDLTFKKSQYQMLQEARSLAIDQQKEITNLKEALRVAREGLIRYGKHKGQCRYQGNDCTCGLENTVAAILEGE